MWPDVAGVGDGRVGLHPAIFLHAIHDIAQLRPPFLGTHHTHLFDLIGGSNRYSTVKHFLMHKRLCPLLPSPPLGAPTVRDGGGREAPVWGGGMESDNIES
jgi:hypothetical protein